MTIWRRCSTAASGLGRIGLVSSPFELRVRAVMGRWRSASLVAESVIISLVQREAIASYRQVDLVPEPAIGSNQSRLQALAQARCSCVYLGTNG